MVIQIGVNGKKVYVQNKGIRKFPVVTPFRSKAWEFTNVGACKNIRDDVLEYHPNAVIVP